MAIAHVEGLAFVRFTVPDLEAMLAFATDFGLKLAHRTEDTLYFRGTSSAPYLHVASLGEPGFAGLAFVASAKEVAALAQFEGVPVEPLAGPAGGIVVRLTDPDGFRVEVVADLSPAIPLEVPPRAPLNDALDHERRGRIPKRLGSGPAHVVRLGHCVLSVSDFRRSESWYKSRFGFVTSDEIVDKDGVFGEANLPVGSFLRCDRGATLTDHHTLFLLATGSPGFHHAAFEVLDFDDLMAGHNHLKAQSRMQEWGVGRHLLGSQIFDYWRDPWGHTVEHWTDGDVFDASWGSHSASVQEALAIQWGPEFPKGVKP